MKVVASVGAVAMVITLGFIISFNIAGIIVACFFFAITLTIFFVANNSFIMQVSSPDVRGMVGGCLQAFRETGVAVGVAIVNLVHDLYLNAKWGKDIPVDRTCQSELFKEYAAVYYRSYSASNLCMAGVGLITMLFGVLAGFNKYEAALLGYPKRLREEYQQFGGTEGGSTYVETEKRAVNDQSVTVENEQSRLLVESPEEKK